MKKSIAKVVFCSLLMAVASFAIVGISNADLKKDVNDCVKGGELGGDHGFTLNWSAPLELDTLSQAIR
jgi:hypothetical protein